MVAVHPPCPFEKPCEESIDGIKTVHKNFGKSVKENIAGDNWKHIAEDRNTECLERRKSKGEHCKRNAAAEFRNRKCACDKYGEFVLKRNHTGYSMTIIVSHSYAT